MKTIIFLVILFLIISCTEAPTEITVEDSNEDGIYHVEPGDEILGNVELFMMPWTIQGSAINVLNNPVSNIAFDMFKRDDSAFKYFGDAYISAGGNSFQSGTQLPYDEWLRVRLVIYESGLAGWIVSFLQSLGLDFFDSLSDYMIDEVYEADVYLSSDGEQQNMKVSSWQKATGNYIQSNQ